MQRVLKEASPQTIVDPIKTRILFCENLKETTATLEELTLDELFWLYEQIEIGDYLREASQKDIERSVNSKQPQHL